MLNFTKHRLAFFFLILFSVVGGTFIAIKFASGYRLDFTTKTLKPTGILSVNSSPNGAQVFINGMLKTATDSNLSLEPGKYAVEIKKEGFTPWKKELVIERELVTSTEAFLFPQVPDLKPLTFDEAANPIPSPDNNRIAYSIPLPNPKAGLWVMDLSDSIFNLGKGSMMIAKSRTGTDFAKSNYFWSPDSRQIVVELTSLNSKYLLDPNQLNQLSSSNDITLTYKTIYENWQDEEVLKNRIRQRKLPLVMQEIVASNAAELQFSPDGTKLMYTATASAEIPPNLASPYIPSSTQKESRKIEPNRLYVYDIREDRNFEIPFNIPSPTPTPKPVKKLSPAPLPLTTNYLLLTTPHWFPTSNHLIWIENDKVVACEYDGTNLTTIYSGSFMNSFVFVSPSSSRIIVLSEIDFALGNTPSPTQSMPKKLATPTPTAPKANLYSVSFR